MTIFVHIANVLFGAAYIVKDILWLRVLCVVAGVTLAPFYISQNLWEPLAWSGVFFSINAYQIWQLLLERRPVHLQPREQRLYQQAFRSLTPREFQKLLEVGQWKQAAPHQPLVVEGKELGDVLVIARGDVDVICDGRSVAQLGEGKFVGEIAFLTGDTPSATVRANGNTDYVAWPKARLKRFLQDNPALRASWQLLLGTDLAAKLKAG